MSVLALLACIGLTPDEVKTVTITSRGSTVAEVVKQVFDQTQVKVGAGDVAALPVLIKVTDMPVKNFLETLSDAVGASWQKEGEIVVMRWNPSMAAESASEERARRMSRLSENLKNWDKQHAQTLDWSNAAFQKRVEETTAQIKRSQERNRGQEEWVSFGNGSNPAFLVLQEAVKKLPRAMMVDMKPNERLVFSTSPNQFQRQLPYSPVSINAFLEARNKVFEAMKRIPTSPYYRVHSGLPREKEKFAEVGELIVRVRNQSTRSEYLSIDVLIASPKGEVIGSANTGLYFRPQGTIPSDLPKGKIKLRPESQKLAFALSRGNRHPFAQEYDVAYPSSPWRFDKDTATVEHLLRDPVKHEPVSFAVADAFFAMAENLKKDLIAYVPDPAAVRAMQRIGGQEVSFEQIFAEAAQYGCRISNRDILFAGTTGADPFGEGHVDRAALAVLIEKIRTQGYLRFKDIGDYVSIRADQARPYEMDYHYLLACSPTIANQVSQISPVSIRICRSLGIKLENAKPGNIDMPIEQWSQTVRDEFMKYLGWGNFRIYGPNMTELAQQEPTESYEASMGARVLLRANVNAADAAWAVDKNGDGRFLYGHQLGARNSPFFGSEPSVASWPRSFEKLRPARIMNAYLSFVLRSEQPQTDSPTIQLANARRSMEAQLLATQYQSRSYEAAQSLQSVAEVVMVGEKDFTLEDFPKGFRDQVEQGRKQQGPMFSPNQVGYKPVIPPQP